MICKKLLIVVFFSIVVWGCEQKGSSNSNKVDTKILPDQEGWNSTIIATTNGQVTASIKYGYMKKYNKKKIVFFEEGVIVDFFNNEGEHTSKLTSEKGKLDENTNNVEAYENVVLVSDSGYTLKTEKLWWDNVVEKVISDQFVTITTIDKDTLYGVGFESDRTLVNWKINEVRGKTDKKFDLNLKNEKLMLSDTTQKEETRITDFEKQVDFDSTMTEKKLKQKK